MTVQTIADEMIAHLQTISDNRAITENTLFDHVSGSYEEQIAALASLGDRVEGKVRDGEVWLRGLNTQINSVNLLFNGLLVTVETHLTQNGNRTFTFGGQRHIMKPDGEILQMIRYAYGKSSWERSPVLVKAEEN